jgi:hypothetical protein
LLAFQIGAIANQSQQHEHSGRRLNKSLKPKIIR